jgi:hypothetical protein
VIPCTKGFTIKPRQEALSFLFSDVAIALSPDHFPTTFPFLYHVSQMPIDIHFALGSYSEGSVVFFEIIKRQ